MIDKRLIPTPDDLSNLIPKKTNLSNGVPLYLFHSSSVDILKLDFVFKAGVAYQSKPLCAGIARDMMLESSVSRPASEVATLFDRLGVVIDRDMTSLSAKLSVYVLKKYVQQVYPVLCDLLINPFFGTKELDIIIAKRRQTLRSNEQKTSVVARNIFYRALYGPNHPEGHYAKPGDEDNITLDDIRTYASQHYRLEDATMILSGNYDEATLHLIDVCFAGNEGCSSVNSGSLEKFPIVGSLEHCYRRYVPSCVQTTLRVGSLLPFDKHTMDCAYFLILNTVLGGYFGSRLMTNVREEKGYTYGIYSMANILQDSIVFYITTDVANGVADAALTEIYKEMEKLCSETVCEDELRLVCNYMAGDFLRSIDGIFERAERFYNMLDHFVDERFTKNYFKAITTVTPEKLQQMAVQTFSQHDLYEVIAGA